MKILFCCILRHIPVLNYPVPRPSFYTCFPSCRFLRFAFYRGFINWQGNLLLSPSSARSPFLPSVAENPPSIFEPREYRIEGRARI